MLSAAAGLIEKFERGISATARRAAQQILAEVPAYRGHVGAGFAQELRANNERAYDILVRSLRGEPVTAEDFDFVRAPMTGPARNGFEVGDYLHAYRIGVSVAWEDIAAGADDGPLREAALSLVQPVLHFIDVSATYVAETFAEVQKDLAVTSERLRRDVLEELLSGRVPSQGAPLEVLVAAGLGAEHSHVLITARPIGPLPLADHVLFAAAGTLGRVAGRPAAPMSVLRGSEVVTIVPVTPARAATLAKALRSVQAKLRGQGAALSIGTSTIVDGLAAMAAAYQEAQHAQALATNIAPVSCLFEQTVFQYLAMTADETAGRLVRRNVTNFVAEDLDNGGVLTTTLLTYADVELSAKAAAARLFVHVNTAHARLARIAERTGCDLRKLDDVNELRVAIALATARLGPLRTAGPPAGPI